MFSIVDIQTEQETDFEELEEGQEADEDEPVHSYPIRCSFNITKVRHPLPFSSSLTESGC